MPSWTRPSASGTGSTPGSFRSTTKPLATDSVLPWVAGFAAAMDQFPTLMAIEDPELIEPLALLYLHFDPADLEDADALAGGHRDPGAPADLAEAVQDIVRAVMLIADVTRPRAPAPRPPSRRPASAAAAPLKEIQAN